MNIPNPGLEDSLAGGGGSALLKAGLGNTQALNFNDFETTENYESVKTSNIGTLLLGGAVRLREDFEVSVSSYSAVPFPSIVGLKYQFLGATEESGTFSAAVSMKTGFSRFSNIGGNAPIGACTGSSDCSISDPNDRFVAGELWAYILSLPVGMKMTESWRIILSPQLTYFDGKYTLSKKNLPTDSKYTGQSKSLFGLRKSIAVGGIHQFAQSWTAEVSAQYHEYTWSDFSRTQNASLNLNLAYLFGNQAK
jgi:hypothetical protein